MANRFEPDTLAAQQAALVAHVRAELGRVGLTPEALAERLGLTVLPAVPQVPEGRPLTPDEVADL